MRIAVKASVELIAVVAYNEPRLGSRHRVALKSQDEPKPQAPQTWRKIPAVEVPVINPKSSRPPPSPPSARGGQRRNPPRRGGATGDHPARPTCTSTDLPNGVPWRALVGAFGTGRWGQSARTATHTHPLVCTDGRARARARRAAHASDARTRGRRGGSGTRPAPRVTPAPPRFPRPAP